MGNLEHFRRVVYRHDWIDPREWATAIDALADLSDTELNAIESAEARPTPNP